MKLINIHGLDEILKFSRLKELLFTALVPRLCRGRCSRGVQAPFSVTHSPLHSPGILMPPPRNEARDICFLTIPLTGLGRKKKKKKRVCHLLARAFTKAEHVLEQKRFVLFSS